MVKRIMIRSFTAAALIASGIAYGQDTTAGGAVEGAAAADQTTPNRADAAVEAEAQAGPAEAGVQADPTRPEAAAGAQVQPDAGPQVRPQAEAEAGIDQPPALPEPDARRDAEMRSRDNLGPNQQNAQASNRRALGVLLDAQGDGVVITEVNPQSPAAQIGLQPGDRIISMNGREFDSRDQFISAVGTYESDEPVELIIDRNGERQALSGQLGAWDDIFGQQRPYAAMRPNFDEAPQGQFPQGQYHGEAIPQGQFHGGGYVTPCDTYYGYGTYYAQPHYGYGYAWDYGYGHGRRAHRRW